MGAAHYPNGDHVASPTNLPRRLLLTLPFLAAPAHARAACTRTKIAELPLTLVDGYPLVPASIAGQSVTLLLDTGAQGMLINPATATALNLPLNGLTRIFGTGGSQQARVVRLPGLRLGGAPMPDMLAPVAALPVDIRADPPLAGLLGAALLVQFDLELDVPAGRIALWSPADCAPSLQGITLPLEVSRAGEAFLPIRVNGEPLLALLDTGTRATILTQGTARRLGLRARRSANVGPGIGGENLPLEHLRVRMGLDGEQAVDTPVSIAPLQLDRGDLLLGLDQIIDRRVWVAYARGEITFGPRSPVPSAPGPRAPLLPGRPPG